MNAGIEVVLVVEAYDVLPRDVIEDLSTHYEASNDSYHRYYPRSNWVYPGVELKAKTNAALAAAGIDLATTDHVLLRFFW